MPTLLPSAVPCLKRAAQRLTTQDAVHVSLTEEANFLSRFGSEGTLVHRRDTFRASKVMLDRVRANSKIQFLTDTTVEDIHDAAKGHVTICAT